MPWLYPKLKPKALLWARPWQQQLQARLAALETIRFGDNCFVAETAQLFAERGRDIELGDRSHVGAGAFLHGPISIGREVGINHDCSFDGGSSGIRIGDYCRIAANVKIYAFNHGFGANALVCEQPVTSQGVLIEHDVWIGTGVAICDGVTIGAHAVIGMGSVVTKAVPEYEIWAGNPAQRIGDRRDKPDYHPG
ncbi:acyltransferase [Ferrimonas lipolytica]|uniref:Acyltransferase n=1 Tax=Ferrimonas lipolytica TaxID=2724191 RepID=A0A6H1UIE8_9GAMM|nr:acyltransferase [Ferrimonas lipolytica]QIZ78885.1 acyltransferase [Ferrimonas lipolytica]